MICLSRHSWVLPGNKHVNGNIPNSKYSRHKWKRRKIEKHCLISSISSYSRQEFWTTLKIIDSFTFKLTICWDFFQGWLKIRGRLESYFCRVDRLNWEISKLGVTPSILHFKGWDTGLRRSENNKMSENKSGNSNSNNDIAVMPIPRLHLYYFFLFGWCTVFLFE